jgi:tetratricopeptide (TPR) repeat protein
MSRHRRPAGRPLPLQRVGAIKIRLVIVSAILIGFLVAAVLSMRVDTEPIPVLITKMRAAFEKKKFDEAEALAHRVLARDPNSTAASLGGGEALMRLGRPLEALEYFEGVHDQDNSQAAFCHVHAGHILCDQLYKFSEAEAHFRRAIQLQPEEPTAYEGLSYVFKQGTRTWERIPTEIKRIAFGLMSVKTMEDLVRNELLSPDLPVILKGSERNPNDPTILLGRANLMRSQQKLAEAEKLLRQAIEIAPASEGAHREAQVRLGQVLLEVGDDGKFLQWYAGATQPMKEHPLFWNTVGARARRAGETKVAARCYWEAAKIDANLQEANYQLGQLLLALGRKDDAAPFLRRAAEIVDYIELTRQNGLRAREIGTGDSDLAMRALAACQKIGNVWEIYGWIRMTVDLDKSNKALQQEQTDAESLLKSLPQERTIAVLQPALKIDLSSLPLPNWTSSQPDSPHSTPSPSNVTFEDRASSAGLKFEFFDGGDPSVHALHKMYQVNGGGVAALDYDRDGWPDLYFTQGAKDLHDPDQTEHLDRLFRNLGDGRLVDVTAHAGVFENGYSQGISIGDVDNDGFADVVVCNIGHNRLFMNNGDGTFSDVSNEFTTTNSRWTSSSVLADVNGDSLPDLYTVSFLEGDALTRVCNNAQKRLDGCLPAQFPASQDQLWLNLGNGHFQNVTVAAGIEQPNGRGTAIIASDVNRSGKLDLFVANDGMPNFYFQNQVAKGGSPPKFLQTALNTGLSLGMDGRPRKSLAIAAGDFNGDGRLDFYGGSDYEEYDTLFLQRKDGMFSDGSLAAGLHAPTYLMIGHGAQSLDADLDGDLDLIVANGSPDNLRNEYLMYEMPPSYLDNDGSGRFTFTSAETLGPYFRGKYLGRSLARLDWNRDGREDVAISNVRAPAALLDNTTAKVGHHLSIRLVGTRSARDAIGATVEVTIGGKKFVRQLSAGDGFQASNERSLVFGLGPSASIEAVTVRWMSGHEQKLSGVPTDTELLIVEGRENPAILTQRVSK